MNKPTWCRHIKWDGFKWIILLGFFKGVVYSIYNFCPICGKPRPRESK